LLNFLPTREEIREWQFPSLGDVNQQQINAACDFVDALNISNLKDEKG